MTSFDSTALPEPRSALYNRATPAVMPIASYCVGWLIRAYRELHAVEHFMRLDHYRLNDLGTARCEIEAVVRGYKS